MGMQDPVGAFFEAAAVASEVLGAEAIAERWSEPSALDGYSVGGLANHLYSATRRLEVVLDEEPSSESPGKIVGLPESYGVNRKDDAVPDPAVLHKFLVEDGERRAKYGAAATLQRFHELVLRLEGRLPAEPLDRLIPLVQVPDGVLPVAEYLRTRVVELVVHSDDLAVSVGLPPVALPDAAASVAVGVLVELARGRSDDLDVIRAFTRAERSDPDVLRVL